MMVNRAFADSKGKLIMTIPSDVEELVLKFVLTNMTTPMANKDKRTYFRISNSFSTMFQK